MGKRNSLISRLSLGLSVSESAEAAAYQKEKLRLTIASIAVGFAYMTVMAFAAGAELVGLPLSFYSGFVVEHRYQLSTQTPGGWIVKQLKMYALALAMGAPLIAGLYAILWTTPAYWWLVAAAGWLAVTVVLGQIFPVFVVPLFYKVTPLADEALIARLKAIAAGTGLRVTEVARLGLSKETRKANAMLSGMGATKRVMLGDTLVDNFQPEEIEVVFAHEVGHYVHHHVVKGIIGSSVVTLAGFLVCDLVLKSAAPALGHTSFAAPSALPLLMLVLSVFSLAMGPIQNGVSRHFERQSDWYALERTRNPEAYKAAFSRLATLNKAELDPARLTVIMFYTHPPIAERLAMADTWGRTRSRSPKA